MFEAKAIEAGNIFPLGTKYSEAMDLKFVDEKGEKKYVVMGSYGIGVSRLMAVIAEIHNDEKGIIWPENVAPFNAHLITLFGKDNDFQEDVKKKAEKLYEDLNKNGIEVLFDDRKDKSPGEKLADADLIGCPYRLIVSPNTISAALCEVKKRANKKPEKLSDFQNVEQLIKYMK